MLLLSRCKFVPQAMLCKLTNVHTPHCGKKWQARLQSVRRLPPCAHVFHVMPSSSSYSLLIANTIASCLSALFLYRIGHIFRGIQIREFCKSSYYSRKLKTQNAGHSTPIVVTPIVVTPIIVTSIVKSSRGEKQERTGIIVSWCRYHRI